MTQPSFNDVYFVIGVGRIVILAVEVAAVVAEPYAEAEADAEAEAETEAEDFDYCCSLPASSKIKSVVEVGSELVECENS